MNAKEAKKIPLRSLDDLVNFNEMLINQQHNGQIDSKTADAINTTVKGQKALLVDLPLQVFKLAVQAQIKKVRIDPAMFGKLGILNPILSGPAQLE